MKLSNQSLSPQSNAGCEENEDHGKGYSNSSKDKIFDILSLKTKSVEDKLEKLCNNNKEGQNQTKHSKSIFRGNALCMDPEQMRFRLNRMSNKQEQKTDRAFLGFSLLRPTPQMRLHALNTLLNSISPTSEEDPATRKLISKHLGRLKISICGDKRDNVLNEKDHAILTDVMVKSGFISTLVIKGPFLGFEERKTACLIWCNLFRRSASEGPMVAFLERNPKLLFSLLHGYHDQATALTSGRMLRECIRYVQLAKLILDSEYFYEIFEFLKISIFEISSDAFITLQAILLEHKRQTADYLKNHFDKFFANLDKLLICDNYVTQVGTLRFLGMMLMDRHFYDFMRQYVQEGDNLKRIILLMSSTSTNIQTEGFHIFKIFVANPDPSPKIRSIFIRNKNRLISLLGMIHSDKYGETFGEEKAYVIKQLKDMSPGSTNSISSSSTDDTDDI